jgi:hypothetical protein
LLNFATIFKAKLAMMMYLFTAIFIFFGKNLNNDNYTQYNDLIANAQQLLVDNKLNNSLVTYKKAFASISFPFPKDAVAAYQVACLQQDYKSANDLLRTCFSLGFTWEFMQSLTCANKHIALIGTKKLVETEYPKLKKQYEASLDFELIHTIDTIFAIEQRIKNSSDSLLYAKTVAENYSKIKKMLFGTTFNLRKKVGIGIAFDPCNMDDPISKIIITFLHQPFSFSDNENNLFQILKKGVIYPSQLAEIYSFEQSKTSVLYDKQKLEEEDKYKFSFNFPFGTKSTDTVFVAKCRKSIGLCSYETALKKQMFHIDKHFYFMDFHDVNEFSGEFLNYLKKNTNNDYDVDCNR